MRGAGNFEHRARHNGSFSAGMSSSSSIWRAAINCPKSWREIKEVRCGPAFA